MQKEKCVNVPLPKPFLCINRKPFSFDSGYEIKLKHHSDELFLNGYTCRNVWVKKKNPLKKTQWDGYAHFHVADWIFGTIEDLFQYIPTPLNHMYKRPTAAFNPSSSAQAYLSYNTNECIAWFDSFTYY
mgnify:CR=1 FL=1